LKARLADQVAGILEPFAVRRVSHMVSVSPAYVDMFRGRYFWLGENDFTVLPFGAAEADYEFLHASPMRQAVFNPHDGRQHWVYVGRGGDDMNFAVNSFFYRTGQHAEDATGIEIQIGGSLHWNELCAEGAGGQNN
jgi:hypothetical protein